VPPERVAALRAAGQATMADPEFLADAKRLGVTIAPVSGQELGSLVARIMDLLPPRLSPGRVKSSRRPELALAPTAGLP
jgi:hypothetical protein